MGNVVSFPVQKLTFSDVERIVKAVRESRFGAVHFDRNETGDVMVTLMPHHLTFDTHYILTKEFGNWVLMDDTSSPIEKAATPEALVLIASARWADRFVGEAEVSFSDDLAPSLTRQQ